MIKLNVLHIGYLSGNLTSGLNNVISGIIKEQKSIFNVDFINIKDKNLDMILVENKVVFSDIVVFHGVYNLIYKKIAKIISNHQKKYIIIPHGSLTRKAQRKSFFKKKIVNVLLLKKFIKNSNHIQFLSESEKSRSLFNKKSIVIPYGIEIKPYFKSEFQTNQITFIGRKDIYYKGLDKLIKMINYSKFNNNIIFNIYGPEVKKSNKIIEKLINQFGLNKTVFNYDSIKGIEKESVIKNSLAVILTSRSEGLPTIFVEALSMGVPIIASKGAGFDDYIYKYNCGWIVNDEIAFNDLMLKLDKKEISIETYNKNAYKCAINEFSWEKVNEKTKQIYIDILEN